MENETMISKCPFSSDPFDDCYVARMSSQDIRDAILYCGGDYMACEIYKRHAGEIMEVYHEETQVQ